VKILKKKKKTLIETKPGHGVRQKTTVIERSEKNYILKFVLHDFDVYNHLSPGSQLVSLLTCIANWRFDT
jgi:hypothetical protein